MNTPVTKDFLITEKPMLKEIQSANGRKETNLSFISPKGMNANTNKSGSSTSIINSQSSSKQNIKNQLEDPVTSCFQESLKILNKITQEFEISAKNNLNSFLYDQQFNKVINGIQLDDKSNFLSENEKVMINKEIIETSEKRLKNYSAVFGLLNSSLADIKDCFVNLNNKNESSDNVLNDYNRKSSQLDYNHKQCKQLINYIVKNKELRQRYSLNEQDFNKLHLGTIEENNNEADCDIFSVDEASCDFSEASMLENALVLPPKNSAFNYLNVKEIIRQRSKKFQLNKEHKEDIGKHKYSPKPEPVNNTIIEHENENEYTEDPENTIIEFCNFDLDLNELNQLNKEEKLMATESDKANHSTHFTTIEQFSNKTTEVIKDEQHLEQLNRKKCVIF
jgi:hypothetical protein